MPAAAAVIGVKAPQTLRSAADVPDLHRAWLLALAAGRDRRDLAALAAEIQAPEDGGWTRAAYDALMSADSSSILAMAAGPALRSQ